MRLVVFGSRYLARCYGLRDVGLLGGWMSVHCSSGVLETSGGRRPAQTSRDSRSRVLAIFLVSLMKTCGCQSYSRKRRAFDLSPALLSSAVCENAWETLGWETRSVMSLSADLFTLQTSAVVVSNWPSCTLYSRPTANSQVA